MGKETNYIWQARFALKTNWLMAINILEHAISEFPDAKNLYFELADIHSNRKNYTLAIENYEKVIKLDTKDDYARFKIGNCYLSIDEAKLALYYYNEISSSMPEVMYNKAIALQRLNKITESIKVLKDLIKMNPDSELPYLFLIEELISSLKSDKAMEYVTIAEKKFPENAMLHFYKALCLSTKNNYLKAYNEYKIAEKLKLKTSNFYQALGICCAHIGKTDEAIEHLNSAIAISPDSSALYLELIKILIEIKDFDQAKNIIDKLKTVNPNSAVLAKNLLKTYTKK